MAGGGLNIVGDYPIICDRLKTRKLSDCGVTDDQLLGACRALLCSMDDLLRTPVFDLISAGVDEYKAYLLHRIGDEKRQDLNRDLFLGRLFFALPWPEEQLKSSINGDPRISSFDFENCLRIKPWPDFAAQAKEVTMGSHPYWLGSLALQATSPKTLRDMLVQKRSKEGEVVFQMKEATWQRGEPGMLRDEVMKSIAKNLGLIFVREEQSIASSDGTLSTATNSVAGSARERVPSALRQGKDGSARRQTTELAPSLPGVESSVPELAAGNGESVNIWVQASNAVRPDRGLCLPCGRKVFVAEDKKPSTFGLRDGARIAPIQAGSRDRPGSVTHTINGLHDSLLPAGDQQFAVLRQLATQMITSGAACGAASDGVDTIIAKLRRKDSVAGLVGSSEMIMSVYVVNYSDEGELPTYCQAMAYAASEAKRLVEGERPQWYEERTQEFLAAFDHLAV